MPTPTYKPLANITLGSSAASVTFSSISQAYRDLVLVVTGTSTANAEMYGEFNNDTTGANYSWVQMGGTGSAGFSNTSAYQGIGQLRTSLSQNTIHIMDYSTTDKHKSYLVRSDVSDAFTIASARRWANTAAITSIKLTSNGGSINSGTVFALYGIAA